MPTTSAARPGRRPDPAREDLWRQRLQRFERSGLSAVTFCAQEGVSAPSFYAWRRRLRTTDQQRARLVSVRLRKFIIISGSTTYPLTLWDVASGSEVRPFQGHTSSVWGV